jgi:hypothetical protein
LHVQRVFQRPYNTPALLCWAFDYVNNNKGLDEKVSQVILKTTWVYGLGFYYFRV